MGLFRPATADAPERNLPLVKRVMYLGILLAGVATGALIVGLATVPSAAPSVNVGARTDLHAGSTDSALFYNEIVNVDAIVCQWFRYN
jgi:hypothetical protein